MKISAPRTSSGFTLIEIMVVLAIMAGLAVLVVPRLESTNSKMKRVVRNMAVGIKRIHHVARLKNQNYRLAIQFEGENKSSSFWVEASSRNVLFTTKDQEEEIAKRVKRKDDEDTGDGFSPDVSFYKKPQILPRGIYFEDVELGDRVINAGRTNIHFLSAGVAQEAVIHITDRATLHWSLYVHPLTGQARAIEGHVALKDMRLE